MDAVVASFAKTSHVFLRDVLCRAVQSSISIVADQRRCEAHFALPYADGYLISLGSTGVVQRLPCGHARKIPHSGSEEAYRQDALHDLSLEHEVYQRLRFSRHVLRVIDYSADGGIVLPYMRRGTLKQFLQEQESDQIDIVQRVKWAVCVAEALSALHSHYIIHCDLKPENVLLDDDLHVYLADFAGSRIDGRKSAAIESVRFYLPRPISNDNSTQTTDLFALGSTVYQIMTGRQPYEDLPDEEVERLYAEKIFPSVKGLPCESVMLRCWQQEMPTAREAYLGILAELPFVDRLSHRLGGFVHRMRNWMAF